MSEANTTASDALKGLHGEDSGRGVVLCVDDNRVDRLILGNIVSKAVPGFRVELATGYDNALARISDENDLARRVAVVLSDKVMGRDREGINGPDLAAALRGKDADSKVAEDMVNVPFVLNSDNRSYEDSDSEDSRETQVLLDEGLIDFFVPKPLSIESIREAVVEAVKKVEERRK